MRTSIQDQILKQKMQEHTEQLEQRRKDLVKQKHKEYELEGIHEEFLWELNAEMSLLRENESLEGTEVSLFKDKLLKSFKYPASKRRQGTEMKTFLEFEYDTIKEKALEEINNRTSLRKKDQLDLELINRFTEDNVIDLIAQQLAYESFIENWRKKQKKNTNLIENVGQRQIAIEEETLYGFTQNQQILFFEAFFHMLGVQKIDYYDLYAFSLLFKGEKPSDTKQKNFAKAYRNAFAREPNLIQDDYQEIIKLVERLPSNVNTFSNKLKAILKKRKDNQ